MRKREVSRQLAKRKITSQNFQDFEKLINIKQSNAHTNIQVTDI